MGTEELFAACRAAGYRVNEEAGTVDGVCHGVAFRLIPADGTLDLSVNISEKNLQNWQRELGEQVQAAPHGFGVRLTGAALSAPDAPNAVERFTAGAEALARVSFTDTFQSYGEPASRYLTGGVGALLGAIAGVIPWVLSGLLGFQLWLFGALISVGAFYGYQLFSGAHNTGFAVGAIIVSSLLALAAGQVLGTAVDIVRYSEAPITFVQALSYCLSPAGLIAVGSNSFFALICCALGFVGIRGKVLAYTHSSGWLRRRK